MSILIKGMEMPSDCRVCPFETYYMNTGKTRCGAAKRTLAENFKTIPFVGRATFCPLIELPPHGRLIDADEFVKRHKDWYCENCERRKNSKGRFVYEIGGAPCRACDIGDMIDAVDDAQTVIGADYPPSVPLKQVWAEVFGEECE